MAVYDFFTFFVYFCVLINAYFNASLLLLEDCILWIAQVLGSTEERLGRSEAQEEVEAHGHVVLVVCDVEGDDLLLFLSVVLYEGEDEAAVLHAGVIHLESFLASIDQGFELDFIAICHVESEVLPFLELGGVEGAGAQEHGHHVIDALRGGVGGVGDFSSVVEEALLEVGFTVRIGVPYLIDVIAFALEGSLAIVEGYEVGSDVGNEGVPHEEEFVGTLASGGDEVASERILPVVFLLGDVEVGGTGLNPDEFPVEIELVFEVLTRLKGRVVHGALCFQGRGSGEQYEANDI